jgi:CheY-like chemotaxis protein
MDENGTLELRRRAEEALARQWPSSEVPVNAEAVLLRNHAGRRILLEATRQIRQSSQGAKVPILAMTASAFAEDKVRCIEAGMNDFIIKPVSSKTLYETLLTWLSMPRS